VVESEIEVGDRESASRGYKALRLFNNRQPCDFMARPLIEDVVVMKRVEVSEVFVVAVCESCLLSNFIGCRRLLRIGGLPEGTKVDL
jgi:hypothetical protein